MELALQLGISQRHVSFVETGRSLPSRNLLIAWLRALDAPLALSNAAMLAAGHALEQLLKAHEPAPALDAEWNLVRGNGGALWLATTLMPAAADLMSQGPVNLLDLLTHPEGLARRVSNLDDVGHGKPAFFSRFTTFGTPHDIPLASLRVEHMVPADDATRSVLMRQSS